MFFGTSSVWLGFARLQSELGSPDPTLSIDPRFGQLDLALNLVEVVVHAVGIIASKGLALDRPIGCLLELGREDVDQLSDLDLGSTGIFLDQTVCRVRRGGLEKTDQLDTNGS
jgi:hypothetical protein